MKKTIATILFILIVLTNNAQLKFYTNGGKTEVKQGKCGMTDLTVKLTLPNTIANYDKLKFHVFLTPNSNTPLNPYMSPVYFIVLEKEIYQGKTTIDLVLKNEEGSSEFTHRNSSASFMNIDSPCKDDSRSEQNYKISFELEGLKFQKYIINSNGEQEPQYYATNLKKYPDALPFDYGFADPNIYPEDKSFSIKKSYDVPVTIQAYKNEMTLFIDPVVLFNFKCFPNAKADEVKTDIIKRIKGNTLPNREETKFDLMIDLCYPCYAKKIKKSGNADADAKINEICLTPSDWKSSKVGGFDGFVLDIPKTIALQNWEKDGSKLNVSSDEEFPWKKLFVFVVEHNNKVYVGTLEHREGKPTSEAAEKLFKDVFDSFKVY